jgi:hypothetical protein
MNLTLKHAVAAIILVLGFATPVVAGPLEDADVAIKRHDYAPTASGAIVISIRVRSRCRLLANVRLLALSGHSMDAS